MGFEHTDGTIKIVSLRLRGGLQEDGLIRRIKEKVAAENTFAVMVDSRVRKGTLWPVSLASMALVGFKEGMQIAMGDLSLVHSSQACCRIKKPSGPSSGGSQAVLASCLGVCY